MNSSEEPGDCRSLWVSQVTLSHSQTEKLYLHHNVNAEMRKKREKMTYVLVWQAYYSVSETEPKILFYFILIYILFYFNQLTHEEMFPDLLWVEISRILPDKGTSRETLSLYRFCGGIQMCMVDPVIHTSVWLPGRSESSCQS